MRFYALWLSGICVFFFIVQSVVPGFTDALLLTSNSVYEPWRFLTAIFLHGDIAHLMYNLFALALFGSMLERMIGGKRFLFVFFVTGIIANLITFNFYDSSLGASGAIMGIIGTLIVVRPGLTVFAFGLPMPIFIAGILWVIGDSIGLFVPSNVGNIAHLAGMFIGLVIGAFYRDWNRKNIVSDRIVLNERYVNDWEDRYLK